MSETDSDNMVGRGNREGAQLFREWFDKLSQTAEQDGQSAYVFVMGSLAEILQVFDLPMVFPEINSLQTAVRRLPSCPLLSKALRRNRFRARSGHVHRRSR